MTRLAAGLLTINGTLVAQLLIFLATLGLLYWLAWGRLVGILEARQKRIQEGIAAAEAAKREREAAEQEYQLRMEQARREGQALLDRVAKQGEELRRELEDKAKEQAQAIVARGRAEIEQERERAVQDLRRQVADLAVQAASRIIGESLDPKKHRELIERTIEEVDVRA